ncbi:MAG TPA: protein phosphatase, partial [Pseudomonas sp.]|nr:protein phosphatase [Pseudomonas sp.]
LQRSMNDGSQLSQNLSEIMLAQDFQDLTGQVIKRVTRLITELESNLLNLVLMAGQVDRVAGIQHDRDAMRAEQEKKKQEKMPSNGEGPQMHADMREDVVSGQDDVDDLLSSLGF